MGLKAVIFQNINGTLTERTVNSGGTLTSSDNIVYVNNTTGGGITLVLPPAPATNQLLIIKDIAGNADTKNITLTGTVDGTVNPIIGSAYGGAGLSWTGSKWVELF